MFKRGQVVMLPTEKAEDCLLLKQGVGHKILQYQKGFFTQEYLQSIYARSFHLHVLLDEEPNPKKNYLYHVDAAGDIHIIAPNTWKPNLRYASAIVGSTQDLMIPFEDGNRTYTIPSPSESFIEKYVEEYNKGNVISKVMVEYAVESYGLSNGEPTVDERLKINPKDNTITIKKIKDSWNREEVEILLEKALYAKASWYSDEVKDWIKQNL